MTNTKFNALPTEVQTKVKERLGAFPKCYVIRENGTYNVSTGCGLSKSYADDYEMLIFLKDDVLTLEEQNLAYINNFYSFPTGYTGKKDWDGLYDAQDNRTPVTYDEEGNFKF